MQNALSIHVTGVVQGVGFRPFVYRLATEKGLTGWVLNASQGVEIHLEGATEPLELFVEQLKADAPVVATISNLLIEPSDLFGCAEFVIRASVAESHPSVRVSPDLPVCEECLRELFDQRDQRYLYPYINCTNCGPRYSIVSSLPYDRCNTTMADWPVGECCSQEYEDPSNRRFHAQPVACDRCGPRYYFLSTDRSSRDYVEAIENAATALIDGKVLAIKGIGGYHLACDARNETALSALRTRKFRKEKPFALMVRDIHVAKMIVDLSQEAADLLLSTPRPIVLARSRCELPGVSPGNAEFGVMLPYAPLHHLLFDAGAPSVLVMTSANRSSEPIVYADEAALSTLSGIADCFLVGERRIARRLDDSVLRVGALGPTILRRSRGYAPGAVACFPAKQPILAVGADLKNTVTLVVEGQAFVSQHIGDLEQYEAFIAFQETIEDLLRMYDIRRDQLVVAHDAHPQYSSSQYVHSLDAQKTISIQHHRAHVASVLAERRAWDTNVIAVSFDGTGYGDDGSIWGGEFFWGNLHSGFNRVAHLRPVLMAGGDAAATYPVQAAAGFLTGLEPLPDLRAVPFQFPRRYFDAATLVGKGVRAFPTTSIGRLFDAAAALLGFIRETTFEGQAAMWLEHLAKHTPPADAYQFPFVSSQLDYRPLLSHVIRDRARGRDVREIARAFQFGIAKGIAGALDILREEYGSSTIVLSGGVFQNDLLVSDLKTLLQNGHFEIWINHEVPANDGGISLGQAAIAVFNNKEVG